MIVISIMDLNPIFKGILIVKILCIFKFLLKKYPHFVTNNIQKIQSIKIDILLFLIFFKTAEYTSDKGDLLAFLEFLEIPIVLFKYFFLLLLVGKFTVLKLRNYAFFDKMTKKINFWKKNESTILIFFFSIR